MINQTKRIPASLNYRYCFAYPQTFDKSTPPARFGFIGMAIGFGVFSFIIAVICTLWFCCIRSKDDYHAQEDSDDEEEEEKRKKVAFTAISAKPHGLQYIA